VLFRSLGKGQFIKVGDDYQEIERWCDGSWIDCADAAKTKENTLHLEYRNSVIENLSGRIGYEHGDRTVNAYNENAFLSLVPFANEHPSNAPNLPNGVPATAYNTMLFYGLNGWGPNSGLNPAAPAGSALAYFFSGNNALVNAQYANENRISELPGMRRYNMADRNRDKLRTGLNWQASEQLGLQAGINYNDDDYDNSRYGLKEARAWSINLDANYQVSERFNVSAFYTYEDQHAKSAGNTYTANSSATSVNGFTAISGGCYSDIATRNQNNKIDSCLDWSADLHDRIDTLGVAFLHKGSMSGKLRLLGDISLTRARSDGRFTGGNYVNNPLAVVGAPADTIAAYYIAATPLPTITTRTVDLRLIADYALDKQSSVRLGYLFSRLRSEDWTYDGMQPGGPTQFLPSDETSPKYSVHVVGVSYMHSFR
jgi:predicted porin